MGKKFDCDIIAKSTFSDDGGTKICDKIETSEVKSIVKNENLISIEIENEEIFDIYQDLIKINIMVESIQKEKNYLQFRVKKQDINKVIELLDRNYPECKVKQNEIVKLSIIGYGIIQDNQVLNKVLEVLNKYKIEINEINLTQAKIEILVREIDKYIVEELHQKLIE